MSDADEAEEVEELDELEPALPGAPKVRPPTDRKAIWAVVAGIVAMYFSASILVFILAPLAIWLGRGALKRIDASEGALGGGAFARAGFWSGIVALALLVMFIILAINYDWPKDGPEEPTGKVSSVPE